MAAAAAERPKAEPEPIVATTLRALVDQQALKRALGHAARVAPRRGTLPWLTDTVRLASTLGLNELRIDATDFDTRLSLWVDANRCLPGAAAVPLRFLRSAVTAMEAGSLLLSPAPGKSTSLAVEGGGVTLAVTQRELGPWPEFAAEEGPWDSAPVTFEAREFVRAARAALSCVEMYNDSRPVLQCLSIKGREGSVEFVAADGFRLALAAAPAAFQGAFAAMVPYRAVKLVCDILGSKPSGTLVMRCPQQGTLLLGDGPVATAAGRVTFGLDGAWVSAYQLPATFPNYLQLIPEAHKTRVTVPAAAFRRAVRLAASAAVDGSGIVRMEASPRQGLTVSSQAAETGSVTVGLAAAVEGEPGRIAVNMRYLSDALRLFEGDVSMDMEEPSKQCVFWSGQSPGLKVVVMPMFVQWGD